MRKFVIVPVRPASSALSVLLLILAGLVGATGAVAGAADAGCEIMPASVDFGDVTLGNVAFELVVVRNVGDVVLHLDPSSDHPSFVPSLDTNDLAPGEQAVLEIRFQPFLPIVSQSGTIDLGPGACAPIPVVGRGIPITGIDLLGIYWDDQFGVAHGEVGLVPTQLPGYLVLKSPTPAAGLAGWEARVEPTAPGAELVDWQLRGGGVNAGLAPDFLVALASPLPGADIYVLAEFSALISLPDTRHEFRVGAPDGASLPGQMSWSEPDGGPRHAMNPVLAGGVVASVTHDTEPDCGFLHRVVDFGPMAVGSRATINDWVSNGTSQEIVITPSCDHPDISIETRVAVIPPGGQGYFTIHFAPSATGVLDAVVDLGTDVCDDVIVLGEATPAPPGGADQIGVFWDAEHTETNLLLDGSTPVVSGYLVLAHPGAPGGVSGWECRLEIVGSGVLANTAFSGQFVNVGIAPDYVVGLASPLPYTDDVVLAQLDFLTLDPFGATLISLLPTSVPGVPGQMNWVSGADTDFLRRMLPATGRDLVATINGEAPVAVSLPTPSVLGRDRSVELSWRVASGDWDGFHVYRRASDGIPERRTAAALAPAPAGLVFHDDLSDAVPGTRLFYSYAALKDGVELGRSAEVEILAPELPAFATRLQPNVPNPFNPATEIRFELGRAQKVDVKIYDVTGRLVRTLVDESRAAGPHAEMWQGRDDAGRPVASGAYYVRLITADGVDNRKIMLLK